jgi:hypothetical protein
MVGEGVMDQKYRMRVGVSPKVCLMKFDPCDFFCGRTPFVLDAQVRCYQQNSAMNAIEPMYLYDFVGHLLDR